MSKLDKVSQEIDQLKSKLGHLWQERGQTDPEVLLLAMRIDRLLNKYDRLLMEEGKAS